MTDPFDALRALPATDVEPDAAFAARLRARLERALRLPPGVTVSDLPNPLLPTTPITQTGSPTMTTISGTTIPGATSPEPAAIVPYLAVAGAPEAIEWYRTALGARLVDEPIVMPDGRVGHAELTLAGARLFLADAHPEIGVTAPVPGAGAAVSLHASVVDVDLATERAVARGAILDRAPADYPHGRNAVIIDPFGHRWMLASEPAAVTKTPTAGAEPDDNAARRPGDIGYASLWVPDVERAAAFFDAVLGWAYGAPHGAGRQVVGATPHHGLQGGVAHPTLMLAFAVADVDAAVDRVRAAGGRAQAPTEQPYGRASMCEDDQGTAFSVFEVGTPAPGAAPPPASGVRAGDLTYVTMEVVDSARARAFYGAVLGWQFQPGRVDDGWQLVDVAPMTGMSGGHDRATVVGVYRVRDLRAAVATVRAAGGTSTDPELQPYGLLATCRDDQGTHFSLLEMP